MLITALRGNTFLPISRFIDKGSCDARPSDAGNCAAVAGAHLCRGQRARRARSVRFPTSRPTEAAQRWLDPDDMGYKM
jgi:hypothetical protein